MVTLQWKGFDFHVFGPQITLGFLEIIAVKIVKSRNKILPWGKVFISGRNLANAEWNFYISNMF